LTIFFCFFSFPYLLFFFFFFFFLYAYFFLFFISFAFSFSFFTLTKHTHTHTHTATRAEKGRETKELTLGESFCSLPLFFTDFLTELGEGKFSLLLDLLYVEEENRERFERGGRLTFWNERDVEQEENCREFLQASERAFGL
jgi:hypothetical protein